jgi:hypothetical protein
MTIKTVQAAQVINISARGITYNDNGQEGFIDLHQCYLNYLKQRFTPAAFKGMSNEDVVKYTERFLAFRQIGNRDMTGWYCDCSVPCIEFHTEPPIIMTFVDYEAFANFQREMLKYEWLTFDRS